MKVVLDGRKMKSNETAHEYLKVTLDFPDYYGGNLDALYDCLTETEEKEIRIEHVKELKNYLGEYADAMLETFRDAARENPNLQLTESE